MISGKSAKSVKAIGAKDKEPLVQLGEINPQKVCDVFSAMAGRYRQHGGETLVDTPIKRFLAALFGCLALLSG